MLLLKLQMNMNKKVQAGLLVSLSAALTILIAWAFVWQTLIPHIQMHMFKTEASMAVNKIDSKPLLADTFIFQGNNYAQGIIRNSLINSIFTLYKSDTINQVDPVMEKSIHELEQYTTTHPDRYDFYLNLAKAYDLEAVLSKNPVFAIKANENYKKALSIIPDRQDVVYPYANSLLNLGAPQLALQMLNQSVAQNPTVPEGHYRLGETYGLLGSVYYDDSLTQLEISLNVNFNADPVLTREIYDKFLRYYYTKKDIERFETTIKRLIVLNPSQASSYGQVLDYIQKTGTLPVINIVDA